MLNGMTLVGGGLCCEAHLPSGGRVLACDLRTRLEGPSHRTRERWPERRG